MKKALIIFGMIISVGFCTRVEAYSHEGILAIMEGHQQSSVELPLPGDYQWYHGCSPTAAGMMMGYYDINGYKGESYDNMVPGGRAEDETFSGPGLVNSIIASSGHIYDFYQGGTGAIGDDLPEPWHDFDCLADFMGTSQDAAHLPNGSTWFFFHGDGRKGTRQDYLDLGFENEGMLGICDYIEYAGYEIESAYNQLTDVYLEKNRIFDSGFTFEDYMTEIDEGRPVKISISTFGGKHSIYGYGYDVETGEILFHDTWSLGEKRMEWGGLYTGSWELLGVTCIELVPIPLPSSLFLSGLGMSLVGIARRHKKRA